MFIGYGRGAARNAVDRASRVGHARASMTLNTYSHVMPLDEVPGEKFLALLRE